MLRRSVSRLPQGGLDREHVRRERLNRLHRYNRRQRFNTNGVVIVEYGLSEADLSVLDQVCARWMARGRGLDVLGDDVEFFARHGGLHDLASGLIEEPVKLRKVVSFVSSGCANWFMPWHQDRSNGFADAWQINAFSSGRHGSADREARATGNWSGPSVPDRVVLSPMVSLRIYLDDCGEDDGPLEVALGSHRFGVLGREAAGKLVGRTKTGICLASRGDIVAMAPLVLRRSQRARSVRGPRRVLYLEYAARSGVAG